MTRSQFLLSPLVLNASNFAGLVGSSGSESGAAIPPAVRDLQLEVRGPPGLWQPDYSVELNAVQLSNRTVNDGTP